MGHSIGTLLKITLYGESHGHGVGCVLEGFPAGVTVDEAAIQADLELRRPGRHKGASPRQESDRVEILSGVYEGRTTGAPIMFMIRNKDTRSGDYRPEIFRPSHADYPAHVKYHGFNDPRGGGMFSGRLTAPLVAAGALVKRYLKESEGIWINSYVRQVGEIEETEDFKGKVCHLEDTLWCLNEETGRRMLQRILEAKEADDSVGGKVSTVVSGLKVGLGEPHFGSVESEISRMMFSVPSVKAVEFGLGTGFASARGSEANDPFIVVDGRICTQTNHNGGVLGGMSTGMPLVFTVTVKPTPSIRKPQEAMDIEKMESVSYSNPGRHDPSILTRVPIVIENVTALVLMDLIMKERAR